MKRERKVAIFNELLGTDRGDNFFVSEALHLCRHGYDQGELCPICNEPEYRAALHQMNIEKEKP